MSYASDSCFINNNWQLLKNTACHFDPVVDGSGELNLNLEGQGLLFVSS